MLCCCVQRPTSVPASWRAYVCQLHHDCPAAMFQLRTVCITGRKHMAMPNKAAGTAVASKTVHVLL